MKTIGGSWWSVWACPECLCFMVSFFSGYLSESIKLMLVNLEKIHLPALPREFKCNLELERSLILYN